MKDDPLYRPLPDSFEAAAPEPAPTPRRRDYSWGLALATFLWLGGAVAALWFIVPKFGEVFEQVKVPMPPATELLLAASRGACRFPWLLVPAVLLASVGLGALRGGARTIAKGCLPLVLTVSIGFLVFSLFSPLMGPLEGMRPPSGRIHRGSPSCR